MFLSLDLNRTSVIKRLETETRSFRPLYKRGLNGLCVLIDFDFADCIDSNPLLHLFDIECM